MKTKTVKNKKPFKVRLKLEIKKNYILYIMVLPVLLYYILFSYIPMAGIQLAFKNYSIKKGIWGSPWAGLEHFRRFFSSYHFGQLMANTLTLSIYTMILGLVTPVLFALMLNYVRNKTWKKTIQMLTYLPYFISTVVMVGMLKMLLDGDGIVNTFLGKIGAGPFGFLTEPSMFSSVYAWSGAWQGLGFGAIIYIAALGGVDYQLHEAAIVDGASIWKRIWHIDLVEIRATIMVMTIMGLGGIINVGFEKVLLMQNNLNLSASNVISTYVYQIGMIQQDYSYSTAVGLFNSVISAILCLISNYTAKKTAGYSLW